VHVALPTPEPLGPVRSACAQLVDYLPSLLDGQRTRVVEPRSPLVHAWGNPPVVLRCGVPRPPGYSRSSPLTTSVDGVLWFQQLADDGVHWTAIRHDANLELVVPRSYDAQGGFLAELDPPIKRTIP
jgi:hypothetical protein